MMSKLTLDDYLELRYLAKRGPAFPKSEPGTDEQLDRLAMLGLIKRDAGLWHITEAARAIVSAIETVAADPARPSQAVLDQCRLLRAELSARALEARGDGE
jgi:hypothetical protein